MKYIDLTCQQCDTEYQLEYDEDNAIGEPTFCPFCGEEIEDIDTESDRDDEEEDDE